MLEVLLYLTPGIVACYYYFHIKGDEIKAIRFIVYAFAFCSVINFFGLSVFYIIENGFSITEPLTTFKEVILYTAIAVFAAILLPNILALINLAWEKIHNAKKKQ